MKRLSPLESVLGRVDDLDTDNLTNLVRRLARERRLLETVFNTIREGILVIQSDGRIDYANARAGNMLGIPDDEVGRRTLWQLVPDLARSLNLDAAERLQDVAGLTREIELTYPEKRVVRLYFVPLEDEADVEVDEGMESGVATGADDPLRDRHAVILADITEARRATVQELEDERVGSIMLLAAGVAHELGNPLNSLTIRLQLMERQLSRMPQGAMRDKFRKSVEVCSGEVERLDQIIRNFLGAIRPSQPDMSEVDLFALLDEVLELLGPELTDSRITVELDTGTMPSPVLGDRNQIKQVFFNVLRNARDAMPDGGIIKIGVREDDEFVHLLIGDTGHGINEEDIARVFQPYYTTKESGHGLGMMIVQRIMRDHGGQIGLDSRAGRGTLVTLQFPQAHRRVRMLEGS